MEIARNIVMILHIIACLVLIAVVLMQSGKSAGLSGTIAGGAETFFGKNKGRTIDAFLRKITVVVAVIFLITSIGLAMIVSNIAEKNNPSVPTTTAPVTLPVTTAPQTEAPAENAEATEQTGENAEGIEDGGEVKDDAAQAPAQQ